MAAVTIHTTQNVRIDYETAGLGARIGAQLVDLATVVLSYLLLVLFIGHLAEVRTETGVVFVLLPIFYLVGYFFLWELLSQGQTLGKKLLRLRVIRLDGEDPTPADFLTRAIFLLPDVVFSLGTLAVLLIVTGPRNQRLGDLVAGTVVISLSDNGGVSLGDILTIRNRDDHEARYPAVQRLTDEDMLVVKQGLLRYRKYRNPAHRQALQLLAQRMEQLLEVADRRQSDEEFLEALLLDYIVLTR